MNFLFLTEAERCGEQSRQQQRCSVNSTSPNSPWSLRRLGALAHTVSPWSPRRVLSLGMPPIKNLADHPLRRGAGACAPFASRTSSRGCARCKRSDERHPSADALAPESVASPRHSLPAPARYQPSRLTSDCAFWPPSDAESRTKSFAFLAFLTGSASQTEIDVTSTKQKTEKFLTGARMHFRLLTFLRVPRLKYLPKFHARRAG
jgi:hypothetical protein